MKYILYAVLAAAIVLGVALRSAETINHNYVFGYDQGRDYLAARAIAVDHKFTLIGAEAGAGFAGLPGVFHGPGYIYILSGLLFLFRGDPYAAIVFLFFLGMGNIVAMFLIARRLFGWRAGVAAGFLTAISPPIIAQSRMIWAPNFSALIALPFFLLFTALSGKKLWQLFLTGLLAAMLYHFEIPMAIPAVVATVLYCAIILRLRRVSGWLALLGGIALGFAPMILFELRHGAFMTGGIQRYLALAGETAPFYPWKEFVGDANVFLYTLYDSFVRVPGISAFLETVILGGGVVFALRREKKTGAKNAVSGLLLLILANFLVFYPYHGPLYPHYLTLLTSLYLLLGAYAASRLLLAFWGSWVIWPWTAAMVMSVFTYYPKTFQTDLRDYGGTAKVRGKMDALDFIYRDAAGKPFGLFIFSPPVYTYPYEYLLRWRSKSAYGYLPTTSEEGLRYLLIEPDPAAPWTYKGWKETVVKPGKPVTVTTLPSGFIIEKYTGKPL